MVHSTLMDSLKDAKMQMVSETTMKTNNKRKASGENADKAGCN